MRGRRLLTGRARDAITPDDGISLEVQATAELSASLARDRTIIAIETIPAFPELQALVGERGGSYLRTTLNERLPQLVQGDSPLYLLLSDISALSLISNWAWSQWPKPEGRTDAVHPALRDTSRIADRTGVCWGLRAGSSALQMDKSKIGVAAANGGELRSPIDPAGWHDFPETEGISMRRARRIDVWREPVGAGRHVLRVEAAFQDSAARPDGTRAAVHEYIVRVSADGDTHEILTLEPEPRILPFPECPGAVANSRRMIGHRLDKLRDDVIAVLPGDQGCTHLNDALRALADVPRLIEKLDSKI